MRWLSLTLLVLLASCDSKPRGADDYVFQQKEWFRPDGTITFKVHNSLADLRRQAPTDAEDLMAWAVIGPSYCEVHIIDPEVVYAPEYIGHEVAHCIYGRWHD